MDIEHLTNEEQVKLYDDVFRVARRITRSRVMARELAQDAVVKLLTTRKWQPGQATTFDQHVKGVVKSLYWAWRTSKRRAYERRAGLEHEAISDAGHSAEQRALDHAEREQDIAAASRTIEKLRAKLVGRELELQILDLGDETTKRADLVRITGRKDVEIKDALARIRRYVNSIEAAERGEADEEEVP